MKPTLDRNWTVVAVAVALFAARPALAQWCAAQTTTYDELGRVKTMSDGRGTIVNTWDSLGRKTLVSDPDRGTWTFQYDPNGNLTAQTDARGATINRSYDVLNRVTLENLPYWSGTAWVSAVAADGEEDVVYEYDGALTAACPGNCDDHCATTQDICNAAVGTCTHTGTPCTTGNGYASDCTPNCTGVTCGGSDGCFGTCWSGSGCTPKSCQSCQSVDSTGGVCNPLPSGTTCHTAQGPCDTTVACDGASPACPSSFLPATTVCHADAGPCDQTDYCSGSGAACPMAYLPSSTLCHSSQGPCDATVYCTGSSATCAPSLLPATAVCAPATSCLLPSSCTGASPGCPVQARLPNESACGAGSFCYAGQCQTAAIVTSLDVEDGGATQLFSGDLYLDGTVDGGWTVVDGTAQVGQ